MNSKIINNKTTINMDTKQLVSAAINSDIRTFRDGMQKMIDQRIVEKISAIKQRTIQQMGFNLIKEMHCDCDDEVDEVEQDDEKAEKPNNIVRARRVRQARTFQD